MSAVNSGAGLSLDLDKSTSTPASFEPTAKLTTGADGQTLFTTGTIEPEANYAALNVPPTPFMPQPIQAARCEVKSTETILDASIPPVEANDNLIRPEEAIARIGHTLQNNPSDKTAILAARQSFHELLQKETLEERNQVTKAWIESPYFLLLLQILDVNPKYFDSARQAESIAALNHLIDLSTGVLGGNKQTDSTIDHAIRLSWLTQLNNDTAYRQVKSAEPKLLSDDFPNVLKQAAKWFNDANRFLEQLTQWNLLDLEDKGVRFVKHKGICLDDLKITPEVIALPNHSVVQIFCAKGRNRSAVAQIMLKEMVELCGADIRVNPQMGGEEQAYSKLSQLRDKTHQNPRKKWISDVMEMERGWNQSFLDLPRYSDAEVAPLIGPRQLPYTLDEAESATDTWETAHARLVAAMRRDIEDAHSRGGRYVMVSMVATALPGAMSLLAQALRDIPHLGHLVDIHLLQIGDYIDNPIAVPGNMPADYYLRSHSYGLRNGGLMQHFMYLLLARHFRIEMHGK